MGNQEPQILAQDDPQLLRVAFSVFISNGQSSNREFLKKVSAAAPGYSKEQYGSVCKRVVELFEHACRYAFRWANENSPGATIDDTVITEVFLDDLARDCAGFTWDEYAQALTYGFDHGIF